MWSTEGYSSTLFSSYSSCHRSLTCHFSLSAPVKKAKRSGIRVGNGASRSKSASGSKKRKIRLSLIPNSFQKLPSINPCLTCFFSFPSSGGGGRRSKSKGGDSCGAKATGGRRRKRSKSTGESKPKKRSGSRRGKRSKSKATPTGGSSCGPQGSGGSKRRKRKCNTPCHDFLPRVWPLPPWLELCFPCFCVRLLRERTFGIQSQIWGTQAASQQQPFMWSSPAVGPEAFKEASQCYSKER